MTRSGSLCMMLTAALLFLAAAVMPAAAGQVLTTPIPPPGSLASSGQFIDESGRVAGFYSDVNTSTVFLYDGTGFTDILPPGATSSSLAGMNNNLGIVGSSCDGFTCSDFVYTNGTFGAVGMPPGASGSSVRAIADNGELVGHAWFPGLNSRAWHFADGVFTEVHPPGDMWSYGYGINNAGQVVGETYTGTEYRAFLYDGGAYSDPSPPSLPNTRAFAINNAGTVVGIGYGDTGARCWMNQAGTAMIINPPGALYSSCVGISESNAVVGWAQTAGGERSFVYRDGSYQFLEARDRGSLFVRDINSSFQVTGSNGFFGQINLKAANSLSLQGAALLTKGGQGEALIGDLLPAPAIQTGQDAMVRGNYAPKLSLTPWGFAGQTVEWWVVAQTPTRTYSFDIASGTWVPGFFPSFTGPLRRMPERVLPPAGFDLGIYTYYFGVDFLVNGIVDPQFLVYEGKTVLHR